jgi:uncharacterized metal-binding protein YceD (DUF177 family)
MAKAPQPEFSRPRTPEQLAAQAETAFAAQADSAECAALARRFGVPAVRALSFALGAAPQAGGGWRITGTVDARLVQTCVVSLEPVETEIAETVDRRFVPQAQLPAPAPGSEMELDAAMTDGPDGFGDSIDLGEIAAETVALAIDPYPRHPDAQFDGAIVGPAGTQAMTDEAARPFAGLAALKARRPES